jgi:hypothetical protein
MGGGDLRYGLRRYWARPPGYSGQFVWNLIVAQRRLLTAE